MTRRAQSMSFDAIAATFLFVLLAVFGAVYAFSYFSGNIGTTLSSEATTLSETVIREISVRGNETGHTEIDTAVLVSLITRTRDEYTTVKNEFGFTKEFCVFIEDENGKLVHVVDTGSGVRLAAFGSSDVVFTNGTSDTGDDVSCG